ncbi:hypothetical protein [Rhizobium sp. Leaf341]|uniref:hypothetical protein n=1 Tax=Rhizobium sp. Leaf341 TaxID=1736344 RepID=UPI000AB06665|nr:hypothetical protein [Rhizobium sp. Leaf341]
MSRTRDPFYSSARKLRRAITLYDRLVDLDRVFRSNLSVNWQTIGPDGEGFYEHIRVPSKAIPEEIEDGMIDCIHNCRAVLDLLVYECGLLKGVSSRQLMFPVASSESALDEMFADKKRQLHRLGEKFQNIVRQQKPYAGGGNLIKDLHDLDIIGKHRTLVELAIITPATLGNMGVAILGARFLNQGLSPLEVAVPIPNRITSRLKSPAGSMGDIYRQMSDVHLLVFADDVPLAGRRVLWNLRSMIAQVDTVRNNVILTLS